MAHTHGVFDTDPHFSIDTDTRVISNLSAGKTIIIQLDHNSECFTFEIPRFVEGHDMSLCDTVRVHYINIGATDRNSDVYTISDLQIDPENENRVVCSWLLSRNTTMYSGTLNFALEFACTNGDEITYAWNTAIYKDIVVSPGINNTEVVSTEYSDTLLEWENEIFGSEAQGVRSINRAVEAGLNQIENAAANNSDFANSVLGSLRGESITINDISPIAHDITTKLSQKNIFNYKDLVAYANSGIGSSGEETVEYLGEDCFCYSEWQTVGYTTFTGIPFERNTQYTFTFEFAFQFENYEEYPMGAFTIRYTDGTHTSTQAPAYSTKFTTVTITSDVGKTIKGLSFSRFANTCTIYVKKNMQIERGTTSTTYTPFIEDMSTVKLTTHSKNILDIYEREPGTLTSGVENTNVRMFEFDKYYKGLSANNYYYPSYVTCELVDDVWNVETTLVGYGLAFPVKVSPNTTYYYSGILESTSSISAYTKDGEYIKAIGSGPLRFTTPENCEVIVLHFNPSAANTPKQYSECMLEVGEIKTEYEAFVAAEYTPNEDGTVEGVKRIYPTTIMYTDTPDVEIVSEYNVDTTKYLNKQLIDLESALDNIIEIQNGLIGGESE